MRTSGSLTSRTNLSQIKIRNRAYSSLNCTERERERVLKLALSLAMYERGSFPSALSADPFPDVMDYERFSNFSKFSERFAFAHVPAAYFGRRVPSPKET